MDVAFIGNTLYALVTIVSDPNTSVVNIGNNPDHNGIYRVDGPGSCTIVADIGAFAIAHPPNADIFLDAGVQYAMEPYRGGFLVTDGHHNRVYRVTLGGEVSEFITFGRRRPDGLAVQGNTIYMAEAGPILGDGSEIGKIIGIDAKSGAVTDVAGPGRWSSTSSGAAARRCSASRRAPTATPTQVRRQNRTPVSSFASTATAASPSSPPDSTSRPHSKSSGRPRTSSPSAAKSGRSTTSQARPTDTERRATEASEGRGRTLPLVKLGLRPGRRVPGRNTDGASRR